MEPEIPKDKRFLRVTILLLFSISFLIPLDTPITGNDTQELEWYVKEGDTKTLIYTKFYSELNNNGNSYQGVQLVRTPEGMINVTIKNGTTIKIEIVELNSVALVNYTYDDNITVNWEQCHYIQKTNTTKSYWEDLLRDNEECSIEGNFIVQRGNRTRFNESAYQLMIYKLNYLTGWVEYELFKVANSTHIFAEVELTALSDDISSDKITYPSIFLSLTGLFALILIIKTRKKCGYK